jgi:hypothetical protein
MLNVVILSVVMLSVVAPNQKLSCPIVYILDGWIGAIHIKDCGRDEATL